MDIITYESWNESEDVDEKGLLPHSPDGQAILNVQDEELLVFCPECFETAETFDRIDHRHWCLYGGPVALGD